MAGTAAVAVAAGGAESSVMVFYLFVEITFRFQSFPSSFHLRAQFRACLLSAHDPDCAVVPMDGIRRPAKEVRLKSCFEREKAALAALAEGRNTLLDPATCSFRARRAREPPQNPSKSSHFWTRFDLIQSENYT